MGLGDWEKVDKLSRDWDRIVGAEDPNAPLQPKSVNPYDEAIETEVDKVSNDDQNLLTAFTLIASHGLESAIGKMMAWYAERSLPYTIDQLFRAHERSSTSNHPQVQALRQNLRGMVIFAYAWAYVMARTNRLAVRDQEIYPYLAEISSTEPDSEERAHLTKTAENKLETTLGLILHSRDDAKKAGSRETALFFEGALLLCYAMSNLHFGRATELDASDA
jgi:hypothetical protein